VPAWIVLFIVLDLIAVAIVLWFVLSRRRHGPSPAGADIRSVARFATGVDGQIGDYLRLNYAGDPETLPRVLPELIGRIESQSRAEGLDLGRDVIESIVMQSIVGHGIARERDVQRALEDMRPEVTL